MYLVHNQSYPHLLFLPSLIFPSPIITSFPSFFFTVFHRVQFMLPTWRWVGNILMWTAYQEPYCKQPLLMKASVDNSA